MIGAVITITCKRRGCSFETEATTNTRCRRCRAVVRVPAAARTLEHTIGIIRLSCGHLAVVIIHPGKSIAAALKRYEWECPDTGATITATRVLAVVSETEWESLTDQDVDLLVTGAAAC
jgi:hypothetical protein